MLIPPDEIRVFFGNFDHNGGGDKGKWRAFHDLVRGLDPHLILRLELTGAAGRGRAGLFAAADALTPTGNPLLRPHAVLAGPAESDNRTGLFVRPDVFKIINEWDRAASPIPWIIPPANITLELVRYSGEPDCSRQMNVAAAHQNHGMPAARDLEAQDLRRLANKPDPRDCTPDHPHVRPREALVGVDSNSNPDDPLPDDLPVPAAKDSPSPQHWGNRSRKLPSGQWGADSGSDETLRHGAFVEVGRHLASRPGTSPEARRRYLASTSTRGRTRVDRYYATPSLATAITDLQVVDLTGLSSHHGLLATVARPLLVQVLTRSHPVDP